MCHAMTIVGIRKKELSLHKNVNSVSSSNIVQRFGVYETYICVFVACMYLLETFALLLLNICPVGQNATNQYLFDSDMFHKIK